MPSCEKIILENKNNGGSIAPNAFIPSGATVEYPINLMHNTTVYASTSLGRYTYINVNTVIYPNVSIGRYCSIARNCEIGVANHPIDWLSTHPFQFDLTIFKNNDDYNHVIKKDWKLHSKTMIGSDVWIGAKVIINTGISIGHGSIIAGGAVVTKDVPPYAIVGGIPAKIIKYRFEENVIIKLLDLEWWKIDLKELNDISFNNINSAIIELSKIKEIR